MQESKKDSMAEEAVRPRPAEYYNPRPLILGLCFIWGIVMGFSLQYFRPVETPIVTTSQTNTPETQPITQPSKAEQTSRRDSAPPVADVDAQFPLNIVQKTTMDNIVISPPPALLTTEGGLTAKLAEPIESSPKPVQPSKRSPANWPPLPELQPW